MTEASRIATMAILVGATIAMALAAAPAGAATASEKRGLRLVQRRCGACHAVRAEDVSRRPTAPPFRDLHRRYDVGNLEEALAEGLSIGHSNMPEFRFKPPQIVDIIGYLRSLEQDRPIETYPR
jgi:mono/diheme cytochrome c family protein